MPFKVPQNIFHPAHKERSDKDRFFVGYSKVNTKYITLKIYFNCCN